MEELYDSYIEHAIGRTPLVPLRNLTSPSIGLNVSAALAIASERGPTQ